MVGQSGQTIALFSLTGGLGMISIWVIEAAPWRAEVPMQSDPVSPPPITTTCLPLALIAAIGRRHGFVVAGVTLVLLRQEIHRVVDAVQITAGDIQVARPFRPAGQHHGVDTRASNASIETSLPTSVLVRNVTPSAAICSMRRSIRCFSILKSGMP